jgi:NADPH:quinone reductase-like Zn-dependent oxidoreductase
MRAASLNYRDLKIVKGAYARKPDLPVVLLSDGAGEVVETGPGVRKFAAGDRVLPIYMSGWHSGPLSERHSGWKSLGGDVDGVAREFATFNEEDLLPIPASLSFEQAACLPCAAVTAWHGLVAAGRVKAGDWVLVMGSGGVSLFALQIALLHGARVVAVSSDDEKLERLREVGASAGVNYTTTPAWGDEVRRLTGDGVDQVVELGGARTIEQSLRATRDSGHIALIGDLSGQPGSADAAERGIAMTRIVVGSRQMTADLLRAIDLHGAMPTIDRTFSFDDLKGALAHLESGQHFGKVVISF